MKTNATCIDCGKPVNAIPNPDGTIPPVVCVKDWFRRSREGKLLPQSETTVPVITGNISDRNAETGLVGGNVTQTAPEGHEMSATLGRNRAPEVTVTMTPKGEIQLRWQTQHGWCSIFTNTNCTAIQAELPNNGGSWGTVVSDDEWVSTVWVGRQDAPRAKRDCRVCGGAGWTDGSAELRRDGHIGSTECIGCDGTGKEATR